MNVTRYILEQPEPQREMMTVLRSWILDLGSHVGERMSRNIPYFTLQGPLCSLGTEPHGVTLSFPRGFQMEGKGHELMESKGRKHARSVTFLSLAQLEEHEASIRQLLNEGAIINEYRRKRALRKK